jgi:hypothetical protein
LRLSSRLTLLNVKIRRADRCAKENADVDRDQQRVDD